MSTEEWRPVDGAPDYEVSNRGRVRSYRRPQGRRATPRILRAQVLPPKGYLRVVLRTELGIRRVRVHRLVAGAFIGPCPDGMQVCHGDGDPANNDVRNLRYGTPSDNQLDQVRHGTHPWARKTHCPQDHPYSPENTYFAPDGRRQCRACGRARHRARGSLRSEVRAWAKSQGIPVAERGRISDVVHDAYAAAHDLRSAA